MKEDKPVSHMEIRRTGAEADVGEMSSVEVTVEHHTQGFPAGWCSTGNCGVYKRSAKHDLYRDENVCGLGKLWIHQKRGNRIIITGSRLQRWDSKDVS